MIADRGFLAFQKHMNEPQMKQKYPNLEIIIPVTKEDQSGRFSKQDVDKSRKEVTAIRSIVEQVHGAQKAWLILRYRQSYQEFFSN